VIEVSISKNPGFLPGNPFSLADQGEAVFVDLGNGRNVVALLASGTFAEKHSYPAHLVTTHFKTSWSDGRQLASLPKLRGHWELAQDDLPTLVTFSNPNDPESFAPGFFKDQNDPPDIVRPLFVRIVPPHVIANLQLGGHVTSRLPGTLSPTHSRHNQAGPRARRKLHMTPLPFGFLF